MFFKLMTANHTTELAIQLKPRAEDVWATKQEQAAGQIRKSGKNKENENSRTITLQVSVCLCQKTTISLAHHGTQ